MPKIKISKIDKTEKTERQQVKTARLKRRVKWRWTRPITNDAACSTCPSYHKLLGSLLGSNAVIFIEEGQMTQGNHIVARCTFGENSQGRNRDSTHVDK